MSKEENEMLSVENDREPKGELKVDVETREKTGVKLKKTIPASPAKMGTIYESAFKRLAAVALSPQQLREFQESFPEIFE